VGLIAHNRYVNNENLRSVHLKEEATCKFLAYCYCWENIHQLTNVFRQKDGAIRNWVKHQQT